MTRALAPLPANASPENPPLVRLRGASLTRSGRRLVDGLDFDLMPGARWALLGANGAGKTTLLRLLRGDAPPDAGGLRQYVLPGPGGPNGPGSLAGEPQPSPLGLRQRLALVSSDMQDLYAVNEWAATGLDVVLAGFADTALLYAPPSPQDRARAEALLEELGLAALAARRMAELSTGEGRKILLARALAVEPAALLLDECLEGLDAPSRREWLDLLDRAAARRPGMAVVFASHRLDELPACLDRALVLRAGRIVCGGSLAETLGLEPAPGGESHPASAGFAGPVPAAAFSEADFLVRIQGADVDLGGARILSDISWTIRPGEHWAVLGPNGAGKSTLLSLLAGAVWPSALSGTPGTVEYGFGAPGEVLDDLRRRIGVVSAALQAGYSYDLTALEAVCSGAEGSIGLYAEPEAATRERAAGLLESFGLSGLAARRIRGLSRGQLRRVLLARALMGRVPMDRDGAGLPALLPPSMVLLDEPMAGLDVGSRRSFRALLERVAGLGVCLVLVTHHGADLPTCINRVLELSGGRVAFQGGRAAHAQWKTARSQGRGRAVSGDSQGAGR